MQRVVILGAGFGGLELATTLSDAVGGDIDVVLIDKNDSFVFGYSKLDVLFGRTTMDAVRLPYHAIAKPGVRFLQETVTAIDPEARVVTTDAGVHEADVLVVALGADYDMDATPGLAEAGNEFYSVAGAGRLAEVLPTFSGGHAIIGVCGAPFKCPPAPSEAALLLHDYLVTRGIRDACRLSIVIPFSKPVPPSPDTSEALVAAFAERDIEFVPSRRVASLDGGRSVAVLDDGAEMPFDLSRHDPSCLGMPLDYLRDFQRFLAPFKFHDPPIVSPGACVLRGGHSRFVFPAQDAPGQRTIRNDTKPKCPQTGKCSTSDIQFMAL